MNLSATKTVTGKGTIAYTYDAAGNKLKKVTTENNAVVNYNGTNNTSIITTTTLYLHGIYESKSYSNPALASLAYNDQLQFMPHEEGRIRKKTDGTFTYDYFLKDHLGNVRMVLTEEAKTDAYPPASMETAQATNESQYYSNLSTTRVAKPSGYPTDTYTNPNDYVAKTNGNGVKIGPAIVLKVMAGDQFNLRANSWWSSVNTPGTPVNPLSELLNALTNSIGSVSTKATSSELSSNSTLNSPAQSFLNSQTYTSSKPKAFVNWILFDEQFKYVSSSSGFEQVGSSGTFTTHVRNGVGINKSGYLYVYVSNETPNIDVFFDNLQVTHIRGPLLEETHYYPFGLSMAGISSKAAGGVENKKKYNGIEFDEDLDLKTYEAYFRNLDPQLGRWWQIDPQIENMDPWSPYASNYDNPITFSDPLGDEPDGDDPPGVGSVSWNFVKGVGQSLWGTVEGIETAIAHPIQTAEGIGHAVSHPIETAKAIGHAVAETYTGFKNGNSDVKANILGKVAGEVGQALVGAEVVKAGTNLIRGTKVAGGAATVAKTADAANSLGNPFKKATLTQVRKSFEKRVAQGTMRRTENPNAYVNKKSGYSYNLDKGGSYGRKGKLVEGPHVDVNRPNPKPKNVPSKRKLDVASE